MTDQPPPSALLDHYQQLEALVREWEQDTGLSASKARANDLLLWAAHRAGVRPQVKVQAVAGKGKRESWKLLDFDAEKVRRLWEEGRTSGDIDAIMGHANSVALARNRIGLPALPHRIRGRKPDRPHPLITSSDLNRHLVRALGNGEYVIRDDNFVEELWRRDPDGIQFGAAHRRLTFVKVMGMTERRVPESLKHIYPT